MSPRARQSFRLLIVLVAFVQYPLPAAGQTRATGFWLEAGAGGAWNLVPGLDDGSTPNIGGYLRIGGTPVRSVMLGGEVVGWARPQPDDIPVANLVFSAVNIGPVALFFPFAKWPIYVKGGLGAALVHLSVDALVGFPVTAHQQGIGATIGAGVDALNLGPFTLTPGISWVGQAFGSQSNNFRRIASNGFLLATMGGRWR